MVVDPYYGREDLSNLCARFVSHLFACPKYPPYTASTTTSTPSPSLPHFIAYALYRTQLRPSVAFAALSLLQRLKARFPTTRGSSGYRLFITAYMIASKVICENTYSNRSWCVVAQGMFPLREVNQMERELCMYLDWELTVDLASLAKLDLVVRKEFQDYKGPRDKSEVPHRSRFFFLSFSQSPSLSTAPL
ncbi:hypothetical protein BDV98DRAFT_629147 [Pterulicium gracile]|uniref:Cyclin-like domain-containing protein n=1 Tax=Pterulicium gracile TaxID=1884261 RepID=A0A5C3Q821_9AGAR|nr:hypothetical protein BDV98DRAFT_629147 [Pterula gracilis]